MCSRRRWYGALFVCILLAMLFTACAPATPQVIEKVVKETVVVEKQVQQTVVVTKEVVKEVTKEVTKEVQKVVTATPVPAPTAPPKTLRIGASLGADMTMDPHNQTYLIAYMMNNAIYDNLVKYNLDTSKAEPSLAESWESSPDAKVWTFKLRANMKFASGNPIDAEAVKWSLLRPGLSKAWLSNYLVPYIDEKSIEVIDARTLKITLLKPFAGFLGLMAAQAAAIMDATEVKKHEKDGDFGKAWLADNSAGSGPYMLKEVKRDARVLMVKNPNFWGEAPKLDSIIVMHILEPGQQQFALEKGDLDVALDLPPEQEKPLSTKGFQILKGEGLFTYWVGMTMLIKPFDNVKVRQAVQYALDYEGIIRDLMKGNAVPASGIIGKGLLGYTPDLLIKQDIEKSKKLLADAGFKDGFDSELYSWPDPATTSLALKIQADLAKVGIRMKYTAQDNAILFPAFKASKIPMIVWAMNPTYFDPDAIMSTHCDKTTQQTQRLGWQDDECTKLLEESRITVDLKKREQLLIQAQKIIVDRGPYAFMYRTVGVGAFHSASSRVKGWKPIPLLTADLRAVSVQ